MPERTDDARRAWLLGQVCAQLADLTMLVEQAGHGGVLTRILSDLRASDDSDRFRRDLGDLQQLLRRCGIVGDIVRGGRVGGLPPLDGHPVEYAFDCPREHEPCDRIALARDAPEDRYCRLHDEPLHSRLLPT